jgi:hypothetical protein
LGNGGVLPLNFAVSFHRSPAFACFIVVLNIFLY